VVPDAALLHFEREHEPTLLALELLDGTDLVDCKIFLRGRFMREEVVADQLFQRPQYPRVGATLKGVAEVFAVDLTVPEEGAEAGVEDAGGRGEGEGPDLRLVPETANPDGALRTFAARVVEERYLR
jgi:hypothetical protein